MADDNDDMNENNKLENVPANDGANGASDGNAALTAAAAVDLPKENISPTMIVEEMRRSYLDYAMSVIVSRALPDVRDGSAMTTINRLRNRRVSSAK